MAELLLMSIASIKNGGIAIIGKIYYYLQQLLAFKMAELLLTRIFSEW